MSTNDTSSAGQSSNSSGTGTSGSTSGGTSGGTGASSRAAEAYEAARDRTSAAYEAARDRASSAYDSASRAAGQATRTVGSGIDSNPMAAVVGGLAVGAVIGALLPRTQREQQLFGQYGERLADTAREAARAAKDTGREKLGELGLNKDAARDRITELVSSTANAAVDAVRGGGQGGQ
ncbi:MAG: hypothetical protein E6G94_15295 [Alphaproteobacteria bacterium]|nr:MAG: hypothetical protein E6G94_15295 [Alphaproteobacteria bacterium]